MKLPSYGQMVSEARKKKLGGLTFSGDDDAMDMLFGGHEKPDPSKLPAFSHKPGTKGHLDELLAHHEHHSEAWHIQHEGGAHSLAKHHAAVITALEDHGLRHYYHHYHDLFAGKHKIHYRGQTFGVNHHWFMNQFDNYSNGRPGSDFKEKADAVFGAIRKRLPE